MKFTLSDVDHVICVSHTSKENLCLRAYLDPRQVSVIPNAIDPTQFTPDPDSAPSIKEQINVVIVSRLVYRKGMDLVIEVIPEICKRFPNVHFIIGGDGPKRLALEEMRERHQLHDRVELLGSIHHNDVKKVLNRGHIFLNCSLTEAFCIAILEAVTAGLYTVSTKVGGVPEVLPEDMMIFADPVAEDIVEALTEAIENIKNVKPLELHARARRMYNWHEVAERTELVYDKIIDLKEVSLFHRLRRYYDCGPFAGKLFCAFVAADYLLWRALEYMLPREDIDEAVDFQSYNVFTEMGDRIWQS
jgi:phosphatidylinositol glycan class A protein